MSSTLEIADSHPSICNVCQRSTLVRKGKSLGVNSIMFFWIAHLENTIKVSPASIQQSSRYYKCYSSFCLLLFLLPGLIILKDYAENGTYQSIIQDSRLDPLFTQFVFFFQLLLHSSELYRYHDRFVLAFSEKNMVD